MKSMYISVSTPTEYGLAFWIFLANGKQQKGLSSSNLELKVSDPLVKSWLA